jgi:hypothetical protein
MSDIKIDVGLSGRYKLQVFKSGKIQRETGWFDNLITNTGLDGITQNANPFRYAQVGSGSAAPAFTDTTLQSRIAGADGGSSPSSESFDTTNRYLRLNFTYTFASGAAAGNISEVGVSPVLAGTSLFSRALVLDSFGNPTSITVLAGEDLVVVYQLQIKQPTADFTGTISGASYTIRASLVGTSSLLQGWQASSGRQQFIAPATNNTHAAYTGSIGAITAQPSGTSASAASAGVTNSAYTPGSYQREGKLTWSTSQANFAIKSFSWAFGPTYWQMELGTAITKNNTQTFRLGVTLAWGRDSGPA